MTACVVVLVIRHRTPVELRGNWWKGFERDFDAYVKANSRSRQDHESRGNLGRRPGRSRDRPLTGACAAPA